MRMLYIAGSSHLLHGVMVDYVIVPESEVQAKLAEGWKLTPLETVKPSESPVEEQEEKVTEKRKPGRPKKVVDHGNQA
jgi:hypothetical protein